jgi:tetratricopeptide (TPR) repeat protein
LASLGSVHSDLDQFDAARADFEQALAICREVHDLYQEAHVLGRLGLLERRQGRTDQARVRYDEALLVSRAIGNRREVGIILGSLADLLV